MNEDFIYTGKTLYAIPHIDFYNLSVIGISAFCIVFFFLQSFKREGINEKTKPQAFKNIEFLRIVFTFTVAHYHYSAVMNRPDLGGYGIVFFFILSGFLLVLTFNRQNSVISFLKRKLFRFLPAIVFLGLLRGLFHKINLSTMLSDFLFFPPLGLSNGFGDASVSWYVGVLVFVSLLYFYLLKTQNEKNADIIIAALTYVSFVSLCKDNSSKQWWDSFASITTFGVLRGLAGMGTGYFLTKFYMAVKPFKINSLFEGGLLLYAIAALVYPPVFPSAPVFLYVVFSLLILCFVYRTGRIAQFFEKASFGKISKYCYTVYIMHIFPVLDILPRLLEKYPDLKNRPFLCGTIIFAATAVLAVLTYHAIERPAVNWLKKNDFIEERTQQERAE